VLRGNVQCDVVIVGAGFTGVSAAYHLARAGASVAVVDAQSVGWGASGRNGGFCCLGGGMASDAALDRRFGQAGRLEWRVAEKDAVDLVGSLVSDLALDVDRHSRGETCLAHRPSDLRHFAEAAARTRENYGVEAAILSASDLPASGMAGPFYGGLTIPIGFGLNPRKYLSGLFQAARDAGVQFFDQSAATALDGRGVATAHGCLQADRVILATNGYSSEDVPAWMAGRYMPAQSTVLVTRPMTKAEQTAQGWNSAQMSYDSRRLLHYFRLMPDGRFLFGMRGGVFSSATAEAGARAKVVRDFRRMFPAWSGVEVTHAWSGMVCLARGMVPFVGPVPGLPHVLAGFAFHGNGIAMGTYVGRILADLALGSQTVVHPRAVRSPARTFPFGRLRRLIMPPLYAAFHLRDLGC
jgi:glycine/D-amino acid oxidase-like deaminating enzyme